MASTPNTPNADVPKGRCLSIFGGGLGLSGGAEPRIGALPASDPLAVLAVREVKSLISTWLECDAPLNAPYRESILHPLRYYQPLISAHLHVWDDQRITAANAVHRHHD
ncbi:Heterokaryon incompatibility protein 6- OR allele [Apiospora arundinis]